MTLPRIGDPSLPLDVDHCARVMEALFDIDTATAHEGFVRGEGSFLNCYHTLNTKRIAFTLWPRSYTLQHPDLETACGYLQEQGLLPEPKIKWHFTPTEHFCLDAPRHPTSLLDLLTLAFFGPRRLRTVEEFAQDYWSCMGIPGTAEVLWLVYGSPSSFGADSRKPFGTGSLVDLWDAGFALPSRTPKSHPIPHLVLRCLVPEFIQAYSRLP